MSGASSPSRTPLGPAEDCQFCAKLRKQGKFPKKCTHKFFPSPLYKATPTPTLWRGSQARVKARLNSATRKATAASFPYPPTSPRATSPTKTLTAVVPETTTSLAVAETPAELTELLLAAAEAGDVEMVKRLVMNGGEIDRQREYDQKSVLQAAASAGQLRVLEFLLQPSTGRDVNTRDKFGLTPLAAALQAGHSQVAEYLIKRGGVVFTEMSEGLSSLWGARLCALAAQGSLDELRKIKEKGGLLKVGDADGRTALHIAAAEGKLDVMKFFVEECGLDVSAMDRWRQTPLSMAEAAGRVEAEAYLKSKGAVVPKPPTPSGVDTSGVIQFRLLEACRRGALSEVEKLITEQSADINLVDYEDRTPLHLAATGGHLELVKWLLDHGCKVDVVDRFGADPFQEALRSGHKEVADLLDSAQGSSSFKQPTALDDEDHERDWSSKCCYRFGDDSRERFHNTMALALSHAPDNSLVSEVWVTDPATLTVRCCSECFGAGSRSSEGKQRAVERYRSAAVSLPIEAGLFFGGRVLRRSSSSQSFDDLTAVRQSMFPLVTSAREAGFKCCTALPIESKSFGSSETLGCVVVYSESSLSSSTSFQSALNYAADALVLEAQCDKQRVTREDYGASLVKMLSVPDLESKESVLPRSLPLDFSVEVFMASGSANRILEWSESQESEDHKAALPLLLLLANLFCMKIPTLSAELQRRFERSVCFLVTVSPIERKHSPVRPDLELAIERMKASSVWTSGESPYFGRPSRMSPIVDNLRRFRSQIYSVWEDFVEKDTLLAKRRPTTPIDREFMEFPVRHVFSSFGPKREGMSGPPSVKVADEHERVSIWATECLRKSKTLSELLSLDNIRALHSLLDLESGRTRGDFRETMVVGSHMFYRFYRVFAPTEEVPAAMEVFHEMLKEIEASGDNGLLIMAFFTFSAIVMYIHPFEDGNGRTGRLFCNMALVWSGFPAILQYKHKVISFDELLEMLWEKVNNQFII